MYALNDTIDIAGEWWDSTDPETQVSGQLSFNRSSGVELRINQAFDMLEGAVRPGDPNPRYDCVHGITVKGEAVTLIDAQQFGSSLHFGSGGIRQPGRLRARILVMGAHLPPNFSFPSVSFRVPGLQVWLARQVVSHQIIFDDQETFARQHYSFGSMPEETFPVPAINSTVSVHYGWDSNTDAYSSIQVSIAAWFTVQPATPQKTDWFLEQDDRLLTLISLLAGELMLADAVQAKVDESHHRVSILFSGKSSTQLVRRDPSDFFMSRASISVPLAKCISDWFDVAPRVERPASLAMSIMASDNLWLHMEFLSLIQVLEGFHRSLYNGDYLSDVAYKDVRTALQAAIPSTVAPDHRAALMSRIRYGNQYSLRKRLGKLEALLSENIRGHLFGMAKSVPTSWIDTRNYYTHWDDELRSGILNSQEMYYANVRLRNFICTLFRLLVGIPASDFEKAFAGSSDAAQQLIHINIIEKREADPSFVPQAIMTISSSKDEPHEGQNTTGEDIDESSIGDAPPPIA